jgi:large subunit ribosomal protein L6
MSRIGKKIIPLPDKVSIAVKDSLVTVKGPKGTLEKDFLPSGITVKQEGKTLQVETASQERTARAKQGMVRAIVNNMVTGVTTGFVRELEINGVGYRAELIGKDKLNLALGFSHPVVFPLPVGITAVIDAKQTRITLSGIDKHLLGQTAANLRGKKPPEPYKGKGVKYVEERIRTKEGKAGAS